MKSVPRKAEEHGPFSDLFARYGEAGGRRLGSQGIVRGCSAHQPFAPEGLVASTIPPSQTSRGCVAGPRRIRGVPLCDMQAVAAE